MRCSACGMMLHKDLVDEVVAKDPWTCPTKWGVPQPRVRGEIVLRGGTVRGAVVFADLVCHAIRLCLVGMGCVGCS